MVPATEFVIPAKAGIQEAEGWQKVARKRFQQPTPFSYLGVPAAPEMSDCYERQPTGHKKLSRPAPLFAAYLLLSRLRLTNLEFR